MNFMTKLFGNVQPQQAPAAPSTPGNIPATTEQTAATVTNPATAPNGTVPVTGAAATGASTGSSVADFADLWQTDPNASSEVGQPLFNVSQDTLLATARKQDFKPVVTQEQMQAIAAGGQEAINAMAEMINNATQVGYAQSVLATTKLIDGALNKSNFAKSADVESRIREVQLRTSLREENPVFSDPAYAPMLETAQKQFQVKYPTATSKELKDMAINYLTGMAQKLTPPKPDATSSKQQPSENWDSFLG